MTPVHKETADLILQALQGKSEAFESLVRKHVPALIGFLRHLSASQEEVEEITQMTFIQVFKNLGKYDRERPFIPWVFSIAKNLFLNERRRVTRRNAYVQKGFIPDSRSIEEMAIVRIQTAELLSPLSTEARLLIELRVFQQLSFAQIAETLGGQEGALRVRFHRLIAGMRQKGRIGEQNS
jgi:RNA polymerase sigma-70 factor (ECF subfamily)